MRKNIVFFSIWNHKSFKYSFSLVQKTFTRFVKKFNYFERVPSFWSILFFSNSIIFFSRKFSYFIPRNRFFFLLVYLFFIHFFYFWNIVFRFILFLHLSEPVSHFIPWFFAGLNFFSCLSAKCLSLISSGWFSQSTKVRVIKRKKMNENIF